MDHYLSPHFTLEEMLDSQTAVRFNFTEQFEPTPQIISNLTSLCINALEPLRCTINKPVIITSGYRCERLNRQVGGSPTSQHRYGMAADLHIPGMTVEELFMKIQGLPIAYDQLIQEFGRWIHISYDPGRNRRQVVRAKKGEFGDTVYERFT